jgi:hypothetical protein
LYLKGAFVDATVHHAIKTRSALVEKRWWSEVRVACVNCRTAGQQRVGKGWPAVVLQRTHHWIGVNLIAGTIQKTAAIIATEVIA